MAWYIGDFDVTMFLLKAIAVILGGVLLSFLVRLFLYDLFKYSQKRKSILHERLRAEGVEVTESQRSVVDETKYKVLSKFFTVIINVIIIIVLIYLVPSLRALSYSFFVGTSVLAIMLGFSLQKPMSSFITGFLIAIYEPIRVGDVVTIDNKYGVVENITLHHVVLRNWENKRWFIPNAMLNEISIENYSQVDSRFLRTFTLTVQHGSDIKKVRRVLLAIMNQTTGVIVPSVASTGEKKHPFVHVSGLTEKGIDLQVGFWSTSIRDSWPVYYTVLETLHHRFAEENILLVGQQPRKQKR